MLTFLIIAVDNTQSMVLLLLLYMNSVLANPNFTWERANNYNVGMDATLLNNHLDVTLEYFINKRDQILIQKTGSTPESAGISSLLPPVNAGKVDNQGYEFSVAYNGKDCQRPAIQSRYKWWLCT